MVSCSGPGPQRVLWEQHGPWTSTGSLETAWTTDISTACGGHTDHTAWSPAAAWTMEVFLGGLIRKTNHSHLRYFVVAQSQGDSVAGQ